MTLRDFAQSIIDDPEYRETIRARARTGTLPPDIELFILEMSDGRLPLTADRAVASPPQSRTLALVPSAIRRFREAE